MTAQTADRTGPATREHADLAQLKSALTRHAVWWGAPSASGMSGLEPALCARSTLHRYGGRGCMTVDGLRPDDLPALRSIAPHAFVNHPNVLSPTLGEHGLPALLAAAGFKTFFRHDGDMRVGSRMSRLCRIGSLEFVLSTTQRLAAYPLLSTGVLRSEERLHDGSHRAVAVLDLVQDFEVLRPLLAAAAAPGSPFDLLVAVSDRVLKSQVWPQAQLFLEVLNIGYFTPLGAADVAAALGSGKSLLLTASESTAASHLFGHSSCRTAPPRALRVTLQHGHECIGLRHHRAHDLDFPAGVRFASDLVLTWDHPDALPDLHPAERHKCVPVGIVKSISERASSLAEQRWHAVAEKPAQKGGVAAARRLLVAENLHSVRFRAPARYQRFLNFIRAAEDDPSIQLTIRSHPASRTLEKQRESNRLEFLDGELRVETLAAFDSFVSPPSTILLDAVLSGVPAVVWTDNAHFGDATNYAALPRVTDLPDWLRQAGSGQASRQQADLGWAVDTSAALNGLPAAWNTLVHLFD